MIDTTDTNNEVIAHNVDNIGIDMGGTNKNIDSSNSNIEMENSRIAELHRKKMLTLEKEKNKRLAAIELVRTYVCICV